MQGFNVAVFLLLSVLAFGKDYTTYFADEFPYNVAATTTDAAGNTYLTGSRSVNINTTDIFVSKLDASGALIFTATFSGKAVDHGNAIALDPSGNILIAGNTSSTNFPLRNPLQALPGMNQTGFVMKLTPDGSMLWSTYLGGTQGDSVLNGTATDAQGNVYIAGQTNAPDYPRTGGLPADFVASSPIGTVSGAFFAKLSSAGDKIVYDGAVAANQHACSGGSSCFLSPISTGGISVSVDAAGNAYVGGNTDGHGITGTPGALLTSGIGAFILKVNANGAALGYLTFLGSGVNGMGNLPSPASTLTAISADAAGNVYLAATTNDPKLPTTPGVLQPKLAIPSQGVNPINGPPTDAYVAKLNSTGSAMIWATFLGGTSADQANAVGVDSAGNVWVSGTTKSSDFPITGGLPQGLEFLAELNTTGSALLYSTRYPQNTLAQTIALDPSRTVHAAGATGIVSAISNGSSGPRIFGVTNTAGGTLAGRVAPGELISIYGVQLGPSTPVAATFNSAGFLPTSLGGVQVTINSTPAPLLYVSDTQINAVTPFGVSAGTSGTLQIAVNGAPLPAFRLFADGAAPQVFQSSIGLAAAINQDGTMNSAAHPAKVGSIVAVWATGAPQPGGIDGQMQTEAQSTCSCAIQVFAFTRYPARVAYAGAAPGTVAGVTQINFEVPNQRPLYFFLSVAGPGTNPGVNGQTSDLVSIFVAP